MGKSKKRKSGNHPKANQSNEPPKKLKQPAASTSTTANPKTSPFASKETPRDKTSSPKAKPTPPSSSNSNPLQTRQQTFLNSLSPTLRHRFFSPDTRTITPAQRAAIWEKQAELGERLVDRYAWATPDDRALEVFRHFGPIVEVGCGANAYWARWMNREGGVDVLALDVSLDAGGKIGLLSDGNEEDGNEEEDGKKKMEKKKKKSDLKEKSDDENENEKRHVKLKRDGLEIRHGGPEMLSSDPQIRDSGRTLFLCYPDEEDDQPPPKHDDDDDDDDDDDNHDDEGLAQPTSMAASCLEHFSGDTIIHVGELYGDTLSLEQAPWGRSSSREFQERGEG
ncbi:hypothetical protein ACHAXS_007900 [Conticribra weissflogii]